jgi:hypothetical protein
LLALIHGREYAATSSFQEQISKPFKKNNIQIMPKIIIMQVTFKVDLPNKILTYKQKKKLG